MKIPRRLEWRAGVALLASAMSLMGLLIALVLVRVDIGMEVPFSPGQTHGQTHGQTLVQTENGWTLNAELPVDRLDLLRRCRQVRLTESDRPDSDRPDSNRPVSDRHVWYAPVSSIDGEWDSEEGVMITRIVIGSQPPPWALAADSTSVQAMLIERRSVPVLKALFESVLRPRQG